MLRRALFSLVSVSFVVICAPVVAAESLLEAIPDSAGAVIRFKSPQKTIDKMVEFANKADPRFGPQVQQLNLMLGVPISNLAMTGVDKGRDWWIAVFPVADREPTMAFVIPATDAAAMKAALGDRFKAVEYEQHLIYTEDADTFKRFEDLLAGKGKSISKLVDARSLAVMDAGDLSVFVNVEQFKKTYKTQLEAAGEELERTLEEFSEMQPEVPGLDLKPIFKIYGDLLKGLLQAVNDAQGFTFAISVQPNGIEITEFLKVAADSRTDKFLQKHAPSEMKLLAKLPADKIVYFGAHGDSSGLRSWVLDLSQAMIKVDDEQKKLFADLRKELGQFKFGSYVGSFGLGDLQTGALRTTAVTEVTPADKMRELSRKMSTAMANLNIAGMKQEVDLKPDAEKIDGHSVDVMTITQEIDEQLDPFGFQKTMIKAMYGPEGMTNRIVYLPDMIVQTTGGGKDAMAVALKALKAKPGSTAKPAAHQAARSHLTEKANLLFLVDLPGLVADALELVIASGQFPDIPIDPAMLKQADGKRSYLGFSLSTEPQGVRMKTFVPLEQIQGIAKLATMIQGMMGGGGLL